MKKRYLALSACLLLGACTSLPVHTQQSAKPPIDNTSPQKHAADMKPSLKQHPPVRPLKATDVPENPASAAASLSSSRYVINTTNYLIANEEHPEEKVLLLTFDDGPTGEATLSLLDTLDRHHAKSIWFVNGRQLATKNKDGHVEIIPEKAKLLQEIHKRGHLIGNHAWSHENLRKLSPERQQEEVLSTNQVIEQIIGEKPRFFRPPFGAYTDTILQLCQAEGMSSINWSVGSLDWEASVYRKENGIAKQVLSTVHKGGNILFHDRVWTARELDHILTELSAEGYQYVLPTEAK
ncbi:polysaccharide deacetylase family protein [Brevibacillus migulae]|uniref:polysaccharide deacetylase family protein n=1 Tax=Brevibacillus migulae TaxID=1644114 RepID=UPI00106E822E|nr:polysaccharide deacetylase family protein [Brevibacillus migulae]